MRLRSGHILESPIEICDGMDNNDNGVKKRAYAVAAAQSLKKYVMGLTVTEKELSMRPIRQLPAVLMFASD